MIYLSFDAHNKAKVTCAHCQKVKVFTAETPEVQERLHHIFTFVMASIRSQGYHEGYLCRKCESKFGVNTKEIRSRCKKYLTLHLFQARRNVKITVS